MFDINVDSLEVLLYCSVNIAPQKLIFWQLLWEEFKHLFNFFLNIYRYHVLNIYLPLFVLQNKYICINPTVI